MQDKNELLKSLPKVDVILNDKRIEELNFISRSILLEAIRETLEKYRRDIMKGIRLNFDYDEILESILNYAAKKNSMHLKKVINATGTVLHTNLGRAVLPHSAAKAALNISSSYSNLEYNIDTGERGSRYTHVEELICKITGAEAAMVVNNNAAAVMLALSTLSKNKEAIVSRGQLVEIGGSFRVPAVMELSGAKLVEVGTTNRTHLYDYENAINENTGAILKVHQSNFKILGFTEEVDIEELVKLGSKAKVPVIEDIGSGVFIDLSQYGLSYEPTVQNSIEKGIDVVTFSGDKLLGGPQAGIIAGKRIYIDQMKVNQLTRAFRIDKLTLAALEATLRLYLDEEKALKEIPSLNMLTKSLDLINKEAVKLSKQLKNKFKDNLKITVEKDFSQVGGGAMPMERLDTYVVAIEPINISTEKLEEELRNNEIPIIVRIFKNRILIDVRTLFDEDYKIIVNAFERLI